MIIKNKILFIEYKMVLYFLVELKDLNGISFGKN